MARNLRSILLYLAAALAVCAFTAAGAVAATTAALPGTVTFETPAGPVTCAVPTEPGWADVVAATSPTKLTAEVISAGSLRCQTTSFGEIELAGAGFPWKLTVNTKNGKAHLKGTKKVVLELTVLSLGAKCVYETGKLTGSLSKETPPVITVSAPRVKLNTKRSLFLCPPGGSFSGSFPLG
jgi:hypothetical protein